MPNINEMLNLLARCKACMTKACAHCGIAEVVERIEDEYPELLEPQ